MEAEYHEPDRNGRDPHVTSRLPDWPSELPSREAESASGFNIFQAMWNHWLLLMVCVTIGGGLGYLHFQQTDSVYASSARIRLIQSSPVIGLEGLGDVGRSRDPLDTHAVLIRSPIIVQRAIQTHNLDELLGPGAEHVITAGLSVSRNDQSEEILDLSFSCGDAHLCQKVLRSLMAAYVDYLGDSQQSSAQRTLQLITQAKDELLNDLLEKETAYEAFRNEASLLWSGDEATNVHTQRLADIESRRSQAILERTMVESRLESLRSLVEQGKSREAILLMIDQFASDEEAIDGEPRPTTLAQQVGPLVVEKALLLEKLGPGHPKVREVRKRIELTRSLLEQQRAGDTANETAPRKDLVVIFMESLQHEIDSQDAQIQQLTDLFQQEAVAARKLLAEENRNRALRDDIGRTKQLFETVLAKLQAAELTKQTGTLSAETVVPPAPGRKVAPIMSRSVAIGSVLGLLAALGLVALLELSQRSYRTPGDVSRHL
ncbi:MAG: GumC family protein, partial [Maioricimonas sp. JB049]